MNVTLSNDKVTTDFRGSVASISFVTRSFILAYKCIFNQVLKTLIDAYLENFFSSFGSDLCVILQAFHQSLRNLNSYIHLPYFSAFYIMQIKSDEIVIWI